MYWPLRAFKAAETEYGSLLIGFIQGGCQSNELPDGGTRIIQPRGAGEGLSHANEGGLEEPEADALPMPMPKPAATATSTASAARRLRRPAAARFNRG